MVPVLLLTLLSYTEGVGKVVGGVSCFERSRYTHRADPNMGEHRTVLRSTLHSVCFRAATAIELVNIWPRGID